MNLREHLREILPDILPEDPAQAIKGTELIKLVRVKLKQGYSDATLRYHFSIMCCDPSSPIAKVEQGQGYYLRGPMNSLQGAQNLISFTQGTFLGGAADAEEQNLQLSRAMKFRTLFARINEGAMRFPFLFDQDAAAAESSDALWRVPSAALVEWGAGEVNDEGEIELDAKSLRLKQSLGLSPFTLTSLKMLLGAGASSLRREFYQCLSQGGWAHRRELVFASPISDGQMADTLRSLGTQYGVAVTSYGLDLERMDEWPSAVQIQVMGEAEFEALASAVQVQRITPGVTSPHLDWDALRESCEENADFAELLDWVHGCLEGGKVVSYPQQVEKKKAAGE